MTIVINNYTIGGLHFRLYRHATTRNGPIGALFLLHGRHGSSEDVDDMAKGLLRQIGNGGNHLDLYIITLDHRNHGTRSVDPKANNTWTEIENNDKHALDMYSIQWGTAQDVSFLIDWLPAYLFPMNERQFEAWGIAGISLGGHSTWISIGQDPRIKVGIPIIGCPDYLALMRYRASNSNITFVPPQIPDILPDLIKSSNPASKDYKSLESKNPFLGKKILVLSGEKDKLVPWEASKSFVEDLEVGNKGLKKVIVQSGVGHECTKEMIEETARFIQAELLD